MAHISFRDVRKSYGKTEVVHGVNVEIENGEFIVILGPSGCGKSTLLRMVAGLEDITSGDIAIGETVVNELEPRERGCAMVFQNYALYPHMTVAQNIGYSLKVAGMPKADRVRRVSETARIIGLSDYLDRKPGQLSGGQRQRVAMGRAIIREPKVFLFDEPLSNLDATLRVQMRLEIRRLHQRLGATSIFVTHDQVEAMTLADRLVVMNGGHIEQIGRPSEVYDLPASRYVGGFIGSPPMNFLRGTVGADGRQVALGDGQVLAIAPELGHGLARGDVQLGVRPEHATVGHGHHGSTLTARFDFMEDLGAGRLFHGRVSGADFIVHSPEKAPPAFGEDIAIQVPPHAIHLFDLETGRRVAGAPAAMQVAAE